MYSNLRAEIKRANMTIGEITRTLDKSSSGFSQKFTGKYEFNLKEMKNIRELLKERTGQEYSLDYLFNED